MKPCVIKRGTDPEAAFGGISDMRHILLALFVTFATPALAEDYARVTDRGAFVLLYQAKA